MESILSDIDLFCIEDNRKKQELFADQLPLLDFDCLEAVLKESCGFFFCQSCSEHTGFKATTELKATYQ